MPARGPAPKSPDKRARRNKDPQVLRIVEATRAGQPDLPTVEVEKNGELTEFIWPARTVEWWRMWGDSPLSAEFTENDWFELLDTAFLHARFWRGDARVASELRQRVANFGATPADRAKLRIQFAQADEADEKRERRTSSARERRGPLRDAG